MRKSRNAVTLAGRCVDGGTRTLDITGPSALGGEDLAAILSAISGRPVADVPVSADAAASGMVEHGVPRALAELFVTFDVAIARGELSVVSSAVEDLTRSKPQTIRDYLTERRAALGISTSS
jgi:NAD(P)H dehydrogenase (quinone)